MIAGTREEELELRAIEQKLKEEREPGVVYWGDNPTKDKFFTQTRLTNKMSTNFNDIYVVTKTRE